MKKSLIVLLVLMLIASCGGNSENTSAPAPAAPPAPAPTPAELLATDLVGLTLDDFYFESYRALIARTPELVLWRGVGDLLQLNEVAMDDQSDLHQRDTFAMYQAVLDALLTYDRSALSADEQLTFDIYEWHLQDRVDQLEFIYYDYRATYSLFGIQDNTRQLFTEVHPLETEGDANDYITRLNGVALKFGQVSNHLNLQEHAGIVEPALTLQVAIDLVAEIAQGEIDDNPYFTHFRDNLDAIPGLSATVRSSLLGAARAATRNSVVPGYLQLLQTLQNKLSNASTSIGVGQFPLGREYYDYLLRHHTTTDLTAAEIHQLGLDELQRISLEMRLIFDQLGYPQGETLLQLFDRVAIDGGIIAAADALSTFEGLIAAADANLDQAFDIFPSSDVVVIPDDFGGYYIGPSLDGTRPGAFYAGTTRDVPWFEMPTLTYHESLPGHHLQVALATEQDAPAFRKVIRFTAMVEGWGLYAERLAFELGWYDTDVYGNLGRLQLEALRAARLVIDTGIHSMGWSFDEATQFGIDNVGSTTGAAQSSAGRYSVIPGQATAYMVGMLQILEARQRAMDQLGAQFDLIAFHRVILSNGSMPLSLLDATIDRYIADTLAAP
jgi:uncharacterized protein (DUF885 family)